ncbi:MAG: hypothetical protein ACRD44_07360, partial [Bryobacteraceae bacterium]
GGSGAYLGNYNFASTANNPNDTGNGYANAFLGNFQTYSEGQRVIGDFWFTNIEVYAQDSWRVHRRLTLDLGVRFYHMKPQENLNKLSAAFWLPSYDRSKAPRLYYPALDSANRQIARDPVTGTTTFPALVATFVPFEAGGYSSPPSFANGMEVAGISDKIPLSIFQPPRVKPALRLGFAWDIFGTGRTAIRAGFGQFFNRGDGNQIHNMNGNAPVTMTSTLYYSTIASVARQRTGAVTPPSPSYVVGHHDFEGLMNGSFGVQHNLGFGTVIDVSYVGSFRRHVLQRRNLNAIPIFSRYDPANADPWSTVTPKRSFNDNFFRPFPGLGNLNAGYFEGGSNYNSLQLSVRRTFSRGMSYGLAYTWSKTMSAGPSDYFPHKARNYGPSGFAHVLAVNYIYEIPGLGKRYRSKLLGAFVDNWTLSGITQIQTGGRFTPGFSWVGTSTARPAPEMTGSGEGARINVLSDPYLAKNERTFERNFRTEAFAPPVPCSWERKVMDCFGNAGVNIMTGPGMNNWDLTLAKEFPMGEKRSLRFRVEAYNVWNHTQFSGLDTAAEFNVVSLQQTDPNFGRFTSAREPRQMSMSLRFQF